MTAALVTVVAVASPAAAAPSATSVTAFPAVTSVGTSVDLTATVTCASDPGGGLGVTFFDGAELLDTVPVVANGQATYTTSFTTPGVHKITAAYNGNASCDASSSTASVQVSPSPAPPIGFPGFCLLTCGGLLNFVVGSINNHIDVG
ncbi:Ig-like domain-containing protein [Streptomyces sp. NPDC049687]|uniref:Ig-like domain-containing protein n=1 Tax=Streptomyces sp. NPDC049687 TaxID=3365596 RepID=UPI00379D6C26